MRHYLAFYWSFIAFFMSTVTNGIKGKSKLVENLTHRTFRDFA